jgi:hypothetical protein
VDFVRCKNYLTQCGNHTECFIYCFIFKSLQ